jgi:hypothetical protein
MTRILLVVAALAAPMAAPAAANAALLEAADAAELAQSMADATDEQGVCYGWEITVDDQGGYGGGGLEAGSNQGPSRPLDRLQCERYVVLQGTVTYVSESCECEDGAYISINSNLAKPPTTKELDQLGLGSGDLLGDEDDTAIINMVEALPFAVAEHGEAPYLQFETSSAPPEQRGQPTNRPGSDSLRERWPLLVLALLVICGGIGWIAAKLLGFLDDPFRTGSHGSDSIHREN